MDLLAHSMRGGPPRIATCPSWMLDEPLAEYLPVNPNILTF
jgi:hypothetical protein